MQGIFIRGLRPKSKREVRERVTVSAKDRKVPYDPSCVTIEATSAFGNEYGGPLVDAPVGSKFYFVGPNPHSDRRFYGSLEVSEKNGVRHYIVK